VRQSLLPPDLPAGRIAHRIGLVADTHMPKRCDGWPPALFDVLRGVDLVLHAGDVGELWVLDQLSAIAPVVAVHGNDESAEAKRELPASQLITVGGARIVMAHGHHPDPQQEVASRADERWGPKLDRWAALGPRAAARIVVFGHIHIPLAKWHDGVLLINPGAIAAGTAVTRQTHQTVALLYLRDDGAPFVVHVNLARPDEPFVPPIDWQADFPAALARFAAPILAPEMVALYPLLRDRIWALPASEHESAWTIWRNVASRCWSGERASLTCVDVLAALRADGTLAPESRAALIGVLDEG
jgi:putative phosphoesterase